MGEELIIEAKEFLEYYKNEIGKVAKKGNKSVPISFQEIVSFSHELGDQLLAKPEEVLAIFELALDELGLIKNARVRLTDLPASQMIKIRDIRAKHLNQLIDINGIVRQASDVRPQIVNAKFECPSCGTVISVLQVDKKFREPSRCSCGRKMNFKLISKEMVDAQRIVIEEAPESLEGGEQPRRMSVFLKEDLVDPKMEERTTPGSKIKVIGLLKEIPMPLQTGGISTRFDLAIEANSVIPKEETFEELEISEEDEREITELAADPKIYEKLSASMAPSIFGYDEIKLSLALQLLSGVRKKRSDGTTVRGDFHVLLVGDPGVAKSVMLKFISNIAPKGRYVSGKGASQAGITASVVRDEFLRGWALEAGAMVLANKGIACIDEMEKMNEQDRSGLHEAMEQQCMLPDFKLMFSNGKYVKIGNFVDTLIEKNRKNLIQGINCEILPVNGIKLLSTDFNKPKIMDACKVSRHLAPKEFVKIELANGREISVTPEHPCWIVENGKITIVSAEKLKENMFFSVPSKILVSTKKYKKINDDLCKIIGYHLSDGCYELNHGKKVGVQFGNNNITLIKDYKQAVEKFFKITPSITKRGKQYSVRVISMKVADAFNKLDKNLLEKGDIKKIPEYIMQLHLRNIRFLIRSLYDGDGSVIFQRRNGCRISFVSQNRELAEQISDLLLRFEITSSIFRDKSSKIWRLDISGQENLGIFLKEIGFLSEKKMSRLNNYCKLNKTYRTIRDVVPNCTDKIKEIFKKLNISQRRFVGHTIDMGVEKHRIFLQKLLKIAEKKLKSFDNKIESEIIKKEISELKRLAFGYARWVKIKKISKIQNKNIKWVYDVSIDPYHTFVSNGMILHNTVTISKANVQASLRAETSVLGAANPKFGRFDPYQTVASQIEMGPTILNRFDLIFVMKDIPQKLRDEAIATHVLLEHRKSAVKPPIEQALLKKFIAYAKQKSVPELTEKAVEEIKRFYVDLRNTPSIKDELIKPIPISARQLEALIRLSEASAKVRLSKKVTKEDAQRAIQIMKFYLLQVGIDQESGSIDIDRITGGVPASERSKIVIVREAIIRLESRTGKLIPVDELKRELQGKIEEPDIDDIMEKLKRIGDIFEPKRGFVQRI